MGAATVQQEHQDEAMSACGNTLNVWSDSVKVLLQPPLFNTEISSMYESHEY